MGDRLIEPQELARLVQEEPDSSLLILDCRSLHEYTRSHVRRAVFVNWSKLEKRRLQQNKVRRLCKWMPD